MTMKLTKTSYEGLIEQDIEALRPLYGKGERGHITDILRDSVNWYYPDNVQVDSEGKSEKQLVEEAWQTLYYSDLLNDREKTNIAKKIRNRYKKDK